MFHLRFLAGLLAAAFVISAAPASADPVVIRPTTSDVQAEYSSLSAAWWQYTLSFPAATSPFFDATGANCAAGQSPDSPVFFLVGSLSGDPVQRDQCVVPAGKQLFFPIINTVDINTDHQTADQLRAEIVAAEDGAHDLHASIDEVVVGHPEQFRTKSTVFSLTLSKGNLLGLHPGTYEPVVADGYYVLVSPLPAGPHTIVFGGVDGNGFTQNITYHLTVR